MTQSNEVEALIRKLDEMNSSVGWDAITLICKLLDALAEARDKALEESMETIANTRNNFLSEEYATPQPLGSIQERIACTACWDAVCAIKSKDTTP